MSDNPKPVALYNRKATFAPDAFIWDTQASNQYHKEYDTPVYTLDSLPDLKRFQWIIDNPGNARHLLMLLEQKKGDTDSFRVMIDRIMASQLAAGVYGTWPSSK